MRWLVISLFIGLSFAHPVTNRPAVDPKSLPPGWTFEDPFGEAGFSKAPATLIYDQTINDVPVATVSVRLFRPPDGRLPEDPRDWIRLMFGYKDAATKTDFTGVKDARFVTRDGFKTLRAEITAPPRSDLRPQKDHLIALWATEVNGRALVMVYDRTVVTYRHGIAAVEVLYDHVRPVVRPAAR